MSTAVVAGAGIVGLTTALTLAQAGFDVTVVERAPELRSQGTSLGLWPNALAVFDSVGVGDRIRAMGRPNVMEFHDAAGRLMRLPGADRPEHTLLLVDRAQFSRELAQAVGTERIRCASGVTTFVESSDAVRVGFTDGTSVECDILVGADGINSVVRQQLLPGTAAATHPGHHNWRAIAPRSPAIDRDVMVIGHEHCRGGYARTRGGAVYWIVAQLDSPEPTGTPADEALARAAHLSDDGWNDDLLELIRATPPDLVIHTPINVVPPLPTWTSRRVALVGDAAHAMSPHITAGATLGIEDAAVLSRALTGPTDVGDALAAYGADRIPRYRRAAELSAAVATYGSAQEYAQRYGAFSDWMVATGEGGGGDHGIDESGAANDVVW